MIKKRNTENNKTEIRESSKRNSPKFGEDTIDLKTYKEEAIEVLNILESQGIDIYDPNNYGGMYLKRKDGTSQKLEIIFSKETQKQKDQEKVEESVNPQLNNLFEFFKNKK